MKLRFLIVSPAFHEFGDWLYCEKPGLERRPHADQHQAHCEQAFLWSDFYTRHLRALGHEAEDCFLDPRLTRAWAEEQGLATSAWRIRWRKRILPMPVRTSTADLVTVESRIRIFQPDVLVLRGHTLFLEADLRRLRRRVPLLVGQYASPLSPISDLSQHHLLLSSLPNYVRYFREHGLRSELLRLGFEDSMIERVGGPNPVPGIPVSFVGKLAEDHGERTHFLTSLAESVGLELWGSGLTGLPAHLLPHYRGFAWGTEMYRVLRDSYLTVNIHARWAENYANNMRMFEATGMGTLLVTDDKDNLGEYFEKNREVLAYRSIPECVELIRHALKHPEERDRIARAGRERTLREHTYRHRMRELVDIVSSLLP